MAEQIRTNWAGNYRYTAAHICEPRSISEVQDLVRNSRMVKALGTRHAFNGIADTSSTQISLRRFDAIDLDGVASTVKVGAGVRYGELATFLDARGYALHNLASLPHISVAGACATATHGSGSHNGNLSTAVAAIEIVKADGEIVNPHYAGAVVGLGALGVVTSVTLRVQPRYLMRQAVYLNLPFAVLESHLEEIFSLGYSVSLFTDWRHGQAAQMWVKRLVTDAEFEPELFGARMAMEKLHPLPGHPEESCTEQLGQAGPWHERLPHFRMDFTPSSGEELQTEYFVPREKAFAAIRAVETLRERITPLLFVSELRTIEADGLWMSPCYHRPSLAIHFTWKPDWDAVRLLLPLIEEQLAPFEARPHWAKLFTNRPARLYERCSGFRLLMDEYDPTGKFRNEFLDLHFPCAAR